MPAPPAMETAPQGQAPEPRIFRLGHCPALDGLRGFAVLAVLVHHFRVPGFRGGFLGVEVFFVLSGFLITCLLLEERDRHGSIRLAYFYARRALRLLPALAVLLLAFGLYAALKYPAERTARVGQTLLITLLYTTNWFAAYDALPDLGLAHTWSLSVEEQFYLLWPPILAGLHRLGLSRRGVAAVVLAGIAASAAGRVVLWHAGASAARLSFGLDTRADALLMGCYAALLVTGGAWARTPEDRKRSRAVSVPAFLALAAACVLAQDGQPYMHCGLYTFVQASVVVLLIAVLTAMPAALSRILEFPPLLWVGRVSYGLYLWHYPVFNAIGTRAAGGGVTNVLYRLAVTFALVSLSYYLVERPALRLKERFSRVAR